MKRSSAIWRCVLLSVVLHLLGAGRSFAKPKPPGPAETRQALKEAPASMSAARAAIGQLREVVDESVQIQIGRCQEVINPPPGRDPDLTAHERQQLPKDAVTNQLNIQRLSQGVLQGFRKCAESLRRYLPALGSQRRLQLDRAIALLLGAEQGYAMSFTAQVQATVAILSKMDCEEALDFRSRSDTQFKYADTDFQDALKILNELAKAQ